MLGLKLPTDPRWVNIAEMNLEKILIDHAFCEQKAASTAFSCHLQSRNLHIIKASRPSFLGSA